MKLLKLLFPVLAGAFVFTHAASQNVLINILTQNSGTVNKGGTVFLEVSVCNTDANDSIPVYKLRPQLSFPSAIVSIPATGHILPDGWTIVSNNGSTVRLSNGTDMIPPNVCRTILVAMNGNDIGGPSTISGTLMFSNGVSPGSAAAGPTHGDNPADNTSTSSCRVTR